MTVNRLLLQVVEKGCKKNPELQLEQSLFVPPVQTAQELSQAIQFSGQLRVTLIVTLPTLSIQYPFPPAKPLSKPLSEVSEPNVPVIP